MAALAKNTADSLQSNPADPHVLSLGGAAFFLSLPLYLQSTSGQAELTPLHSILFFFVSEGNKKNGLHSQMFVQKVIIGRTMSDIGVSTNPENYCTYFM